MTNTIGTFNQNSWGGYLGCCSKTEESPTTSIATTTYNLPENPYKGSTSNPSELYGRTSKFLSDLLTARMNVEAGRTNSILTGVGDDNFLIFRGFQIAAAAGGAYSFLSYIPNVQRANLEAQKDTDPLAFLFSSK